MKPACDVAIVGGGVAGLSLGFELARRGADVSVLEAGNGTNGQAGMNQAASRVPVALLNPHRGRTARARPSDLAGLAAMWRLVGELRELGLDPGARRSGVFRVAPTARQAQLWRQVANTYDGAAWIETGDAPPGVHAPHGGLLVRDGGMVETTRFLAALGLAAVGAGAVVRTGTLVTGLRQEDGRPVLATVPSSDGEAGETDERELVAGHVVLCMGSASGPPGCRLPRLSAEGGVAAVLRADARTMARLAALPPIAGAVNGAFLADRIVVTGGSLPADVPDAHQLRAAALGLRDALAWAVPDVRSAQLEDAWFGVRARRPSGTPVVRRLAPNVTYYGGLGGRGFLCAADLSTKLAESLVARLGPRRSPS